MFDSTILFLSLFVFWDAAQLIRIGRRCHCGGDAARRKTGVNDSEAVHQQLFLFVCISELRPFFFNVMELLVLHEHEPRQNPSTAQMKQLIDKAQDYFSWTFHQVDSNEETRLKRVGC